MKRGTLIISCVALAMLTACQQKHSQPTTWQETPREPLAELDTTPPLEADPYADDVYETDTSTRTVSDPVIEDRTTEMAVEDDAVATEPTPESEQRIHILRPGDTLYKLAREYYGDGTRWKDIWEANKDILNPDRLEVGLKLVIP